jgi:hypothetical protein
VAAQERLLSIHDELFLDAPGGVTESTGWPEGNSGRRARLRIPKSSISKRSFSFQKMIDLREENALFHVLASRSRSASKMLVILAQILVQLPHPIVLRLKCSGWNATKLFTLRPKRYETPRSILHRSGEKAPSP